MIFLLFLLLSFLPIKSFASNDLKKVLYNETHFLYELNSLNTDPKPPDSLDQNFKKKDTDHIGKFLLYDSEIVFEDSFEIKEILYPLAFAKKGLLVQKKIIEERHKNQTSSHFALNMLHDLEHKILWDVKRISNLGFDTSFFFNNLNLNCELQHDVNFI